MNGVQVLGHFERISDAPDAIPRLRRFILDLAVRGKLVEQDSNDESASELLKRIRAEKARLVTDGKIGKQSLVRDNAEVELPFCVPETWEWTPATYPTFLISDLGRKIQTKDVLQAGKFPVVDQGKMFIRGYCNDSDKVIYVKEPVIIFGDHTRETKLVDFDFVVGADGVKILKPIQIVPAYYFLTLQWLPLDSRGYGRHFKLLRAMKIPLPPLAEQHRIVAKVHELMALCDRLETAQAERESRRDRLAAASLNRLNNGGDADAFREHARFHFRHLGRLTTRPEHIQQLRQTIVNLAVRGKLVPQDPKDEPASELLKRIQAEKSRSVNAGKIKPQRSLPASEDAQGPFRLPTNWRWVRLGELIIDSGAGWSPKSEGYPRSGDNWGVLKVSAVSWDKFLPDENKQLMPGVVPPPATEVHAGDFLISRANTSELVAKCVVVDGEPRKLILSDKIVRLQIAKSCSKKFLGMVNNHAAHARAYYAGEASGTSLSMKNVSRAVIYALLVPLPPLAEQHRIVAKVEELMALCERLEAQLTTTQTESHHLLEAVLHEALKLRTGNDRSAHL